MNRCKMQLFSLKFLPKLSKFGLSHIVQFIFWFFMVSVFLKLFYHSSVLFWIFYITLLRSTEESLYFLLVKCSNGYKWCLKCLASRLSKGLGLSFPSVHCNLAPSQFFYLLIYGVIDIGSSSGSYIFGICNTKFQFLRLNTQNKKYVENSLLR